MQGKIWWPFSKCLEVILSIHNYDEHAKKVVFPFPGMFVCIPNLKMS